MKKAGFVAFEIGNFKLLTKYSKKNKLSYLGDIIDSIDILVTGIANIIYFPFNFLATLYGFIPKIRILDANTELKGKQMDKEKYAREINYKCPDCEFAFNKAACETCRYKYGLEQHIKNISD
ncbi:hypothetical protein FQB35_04475 [Crassaminicella thermophila]|uniref:Uncharacterized protein n=1 Tax=Crassaminicella thermophila TaxID=2599308 RepID=A0A5C0SAS4_CRATE|nr:hypothetical protein [Crassaminicella thermophila]QEK11675.1 hypothetical protein FQB35_04475 [Crassaminicella thermophila]